MKECDIHSTTYLELVALQRNNRPNSMGWDGEEKE
jgi:hypothetical protein